MNKSINEPKGVYSVVHNETGEIETQLYFGDRIVRASCHEDIIKGYNKDKKFVKLFDGTEELFKLLGNSGVFSTAIRLSKFVCYTDCVLRHNGHGNGKVMDIHDLSDEMKIPYNTLRKHMNVLYSNGILAYCKTGTRGNPEAISDCILANPDVFMRGIDVNASVLAVFRNAGWEGYENALDIKEKSSTG